MAEDPTREPLLSGAGATTPPAASRAAGGPHHDRRPATSLLTWGAVALVLVIVVVLVVIKVTGTSTAGTPSGVTPPAPAPSAVVTAVTSIPASVYDTVGVTSSEAAVTPPTLLHRQPPLRAQGKPELVFIGDEFCPYCAAERWSLVAALSRFGRFKVLNAIQSGANEVFPATPTFTFDGSRYTSKYLTATLVEHYGEQKNSAGTAYALLHPLTRAERALMARYDTQDTSSPGGLVPFVDVGNLAAVSGGEYSPSVFEQLSVNQVATGLTDAKDPATQAIVATANYLSAAICQADGQAPSAVCGSKGVAEAAAALGLPGATTTAARSPAS